MGQELLWALEQNLRIKTAAASVFLLLAVTYIVPKIVEPVIVAVDFKYFWLAGTLWQDGINPYGPAFLERAREIFVSGSVPPQWAYPPHFRPISELMALASFETSAVIWRSFCVVAIAGGTLSLFAAVRETSRFPVYVMMVFVAIALTFSATAATVAIGQSSALIFFGYCLFVYGYLRDMRISLCIALILLMIKPTYGFIPALFLLAHFRYFGLILLSAAITVAISVWGIWGHGIQEITAGLIDSFAKYKYAQINLAPEMTGLRHLVYAVGFGETSQVVYVLVGSTLAFSLGLFTYAKDLAEPDRIRAVVLLGLLMLLFAPMHTYDGCFALAVVVPALALSRLEALICIPLLLITWRSNNLAVVTGLKLEETQTFAGSTLISCASAITLLALAAVLLQQKVPRAEP